VLASVCRCACDCRCCYVLCRSHLPSQISAWEALTENISASQFSPFWPLVEVHLRSGLSQLQPSLRHDALACLVVLVRAYPVVVRTTAPRLIASVLRVLARIEQRLVVRTLAASFLPPPLLTKALRKRAGAKRGGTESNKDGFWGLGSRTWLFRKLSSTDSRIVCVYTLQLLLALIARGPRNSSRGGGATTLSSSSWQASGVFARPHAKLDVIWSATPGTGMQCVLPLRTTSADRDAALAADADCASPGDECGVGVESTSGAGAFTATGKPAVSLFACLVDAWRALAPDEAHTASAATLARLSLVAEALHSAATLPPHVLREADSAVPAPAELLASLSSTVMKHFPCVVWFCFVLFYFVWFRLVSCSCALGLGPSFPLPTPPMLCCCPRFRASDAAGREGTRIPRKRLAAAVSRLLTYLLRVHPELQSAAGPPKWLDTVVDHLCGDMMADGRISASATGEGLLWLTWSFAAG